MFALCLATMCPHSSQAVIKKTEHYILTDYQIKRFLWQKAFDHPMFETAVNLEQFKELLFDDYALTMHSPLKLFRNAIQMIFNRVITKSTKTVRLQSLNLKKFLTKQLGFCPPECMSHEEREIRDHNQYAILELYNSNAHKTVRSTSLSNGSIETWLVCEQIYQACKEYISPIAYRTRNRRGDKPNQIPHFFIIVKKDATGITFITYPYESQRNLIHNPIPLKVPKRFNWYPVAAGALSTVLTTIVAGGFYEWLILVTQAL